MKRLPFGIQNFKEIINENYLYIDKTQDIYNLIAKDIKYSFLSRPRRFGKSLLVSTLKEIFSGNKELFKDLWIYDKIEFKKHPIIHIDYSSINYETPKLLKEGIHRKLNYIAESYGFQIKESNYKDAFEILIKELSKKGKVVILIDEYDKPIIDHIKNSEIANKNRSILKHFYETIKASDEYIRFAFLTGVSKFSKVSVFSGLNNLQDLTLDNRFSKMLGYTEHELHSYFSEYIKDVSNKYNKPIQNLKKEIKNWYNGYSWDGENFIYNPFSIIAFFTKKEFGNYWFSSGTPTFLIEKIREYDINISGLENYHADSDVFDSFDIEKMNVHSLLFQTGYLTIKEINFFGLIKEYKLSYPNLEVKESLLKNILSNFANSHNKSGLTAVKLSKSINENSIDKFITQLKYLYSSIPYDLIIKNKEAYYHTVFYLALTLVGIYINCEVHVSTGRIDAVIKTDTHIYIIEFKLGKAQKALKQIEKLKYFEKYQSSEKQITLIGIGFDVENRNIGDYLVKKI